MRSDKSATQMKAHSQLYSQCSSRSRKHPQSQEDSRKSCLEVKTKSISLSPQDKPLLLISQFNHRRVSYNCLAQTGWTSGIRKQLAQQTTYTIKV